jgi:hypothetical protein
MKPEIKAAWLSALRSGEYQQGTGSLQSSDGTFCCLGVLCDLAAKQGIGRWDRMDSSYTFYYAVNGAFVCDYLPQTIQDWAGLRSVAPVASKQSLASWNDGTDGVVRPHTFAEIADLIEAEL